MDVKRVFQVIESCAIGFYSGESKSELTTELTDIQIETPVLDIEGALPRFGNDMNRYNSLFSEFIQSLPGTLTQMRLDYSSKDWRGLANKAHNLKGLSANFGAMQLSAKAFELDEQCRNDEIELVEKSLEEIDRMMHDINDLARDIIKVNNKLN
jgi:HPt (histidine-containing phosphotransfer) domain-containing protein